MITDTCCFTGHRMIPKNKIPEIKNRIKIEVVSLINQGIKYFQTGGALGFDTLAAQTIIEVKNNYPKVKLFLAIPCKDQTSTWRSEDRQMYEAIKNKADNVVCLFEKYEKGCMLKRNRFMVNNSKFVIAAWDGRKYGGTYYTLNYAKKLNKRIILLDY